jgi:hypothetical protein
MISCSLSAAKTFGFKFPVLRPCLAYLLRRIWTQGFEFWRVLSHLSGHSGFLAAGCVHLMTQLLQASMTTSLSILPSLLQSSQLQLTSLSTVTAFAWQWFSQRLPLLLPPQYVRICYPSLWGEGCYLLVRPSSPHLVFSACHGSPGWAGPGCFSSCTRCSRVVFCIG